MVDVRGMNRLLGEHPFFADFGAEAIEMLAGCAANEHFPAGTLIAREGQTADRFYLIRHGSVALEIRVPGRQPLIVETLDAGEILGWSWIVPPYRWAYDVRAVTLTRAISLEATCLRDKCDADHSLGYEVYVRVVGVMADRLAATRLRLVDMYAPPAQAKSGKVGAGKTGASKS